MATNSQCGNLSDNATRLNNAITSSATSVADTGKATRGKETFDAIMKPIRDAKEAEKTATGAEKTKLMDEIHSHYAEGKKGNEPVTPATSAISKAIQANSDVKAYIHSMSVNDFGKARSEIQTTFGGEQARMMEMQYKDAKLGSLENALSSSGKGTPSLTDEIATIRSRGILSDSDLNKMRGMEEILNMGDDAFAKGKARSTYNSLSNKLGDNIAQDIFERKISDNLDKINDKTGTQNILDTAFGKSLSGDEKKVLEDYANGKLKPDANTFETTAAMLRKMDQSTLSAIQKAVEPLDELQFGAKRSVYEKASQSNIGKAWDKTGKAAKGALALGTAALTVLYGIPQSLLWYATSTQTNFGEMNGLYEQFGVEDKTASEIDKLLLEDKDLARINEFLSNMFGAENKLPYSLFLSIPIYGDYVRSYLADGMNDARDSIGANFERLFEKLEERGLVTGDNSELGFRRTTDEERKAMFAKTPDKLFENDADFINKYAPWKDSTGAFKGEKELTPAQAMALYYGKTDSYGKLGIGYDDARNNALMNAVRDYGKEHDMKTRETTTSTEIPTAKGASTVTEDDLYRTAIEQRMKKYNETEEKAKVVVDRELTGLMTKNGGDSVAALAQMTGTTVKGDYRAKSSGGSGGGSGGGSESETSTTKKYSGEVAMIAKQIADNRPVTYQEKSKLIDGYSNDGKVDIKKLKEDTNEEMSITDMAAVSKEKTVNGFGDYAKNMKSGKGDAGQQEKNKRDIDQMMQEDKEKTGKAMLERYGCGN